MRLKASRTIAVVAGLGLAAVAVAAVADAAVVKTKPASSWQANGNVRTVIVSGNVAYLGGNFTAMLPPGSTGSGAVTRNHAAAVNLTTGALLPWNPNVNNTVFTIKPSGSNVYIGGAFTSVNGTARKYVAEVNNSSGALVTAFKATSPNNQVRGLDVLGGNLYIGGLFTKLGGTTANYVARVNATTGVWDKSWAPVVDGEVAAIAHNMAGNRVVLGGFFNNLNGQSSIAVGAVDTNTGASVAWAWHGPLFPIRPFQVLRFAQDGDTLFGAGTGNGGSAMSWNINTGDLNYIEGLEGNVVGVGVADGVLYIGGHFHGYCGLIPGNNFCTVQASRVHLMAVDEQTGALLPWNPGANGTLGIFDLAAGGTSVATGGEFTKLGGVAQQHFGLFRE